MMRAKLQSGAKAPHSMRYRVGHVMKPREAHGVRAVYRRFSHEIQKSYSSLTCSILR